MSHYMTALAMKQKGLKPATKIVLYWLADHHNGETGDCFPSHKRLAECCEMTRQSIINNLKILEEKNLIKIIPRFRENGSHTSNIYELLLIDIDEDKKVVKNFDEGSKKTSRKLVKKLHTHNLVNNIPVKKHIIPEEYKGWYGCAFEYFWSMYPRKVGKAKAWDAFYNAIGLVNKDLIYNAVEQFADSVKNKEPKFIPHASTWLNQERWLDDIELPEELNNIDKGFRTLVNDIARMRNG